MKEIVVLGAAESGVGAAILAKDKGLPVFVSDSGLIRDKYKDMLRAEGVEWEEGGHTAERVLDAAEIIKSPGIPKEVPLMRQAAAKGISIISEIEFAARYTNARMVCITGSNGKTTTTSLIYHIFKKAGLNVGLAGNIGHSLALQVAREPHDWYVIELSSFQLDNMYRFKADIAVLLNITPDHLDRYENSFERYAEAKMRITQNQTAAQHFVYWQDDAVVAAQLAKRAVAATPLPFAVERQAETAAFIADGRLVVERPAEFSLPQTDLALPGKHNIYNQLAAATACVAAGISGETIADGLRTFQGVEHRLERVCEADGVLYVNDSKATNVDACWYALESMTRPTVLIVGGTDKGNDYAPIVKLARDKCKALVYLGKDNAKLHANFDALGLPVRDTHSMAACMAACRELAAPGDTVLLSPCCASFDLFHNMEDRGTQFKALARKFAAQ